MQPVEEKPTIGVILIGDQPVSMAGLEAICASAEDIRVLVQVDCAQALEALRKYRPDLVVIDAYLPAFCSEDIVGEAKGGQPCVPVLVLAPVIDKLHLRSMLAAGASGYLLKTEPAEAILEAIRAVARGQTILSAALAGLLAKPGVRQPPSLAELTPREQEILRLIAQGSNNQEIAAALNLADGTVKNHVVSIYAKLGVRSRVEALLWAQKHTGGWRG